MADQPRRILKAPEAAKWIGVSVAKLYRLRQTEPLLQGFEIPSSGPGNRSSRRWDSTQLDCWIEERKVASGGSA